MLVFFIPGPLPLLVDVRSIIFCPGTTERDPAGFSSGVPLTPEAYTAHAGPRSRASSRISPRPRTLPGAGGGLCWVDLLAVPQGPTLVLSLLSHNVLNLCKSPNVSLQSSGTPLSFFITEDERRSAGLPCQPV